MTADGTIGGASGIGEATVELSVAEGAQVMIAGGRTNFETTAPSAPV